MADTTPAGVNAALANPREDLKAFDELEHNLFSYRYAIAELETLGEALDPKKATDERSEAVALLGEKLQNLLISQKVGDLLERLDTHDGLLDERHKAQLKVVKRDRERLVRIPVELNTSFNRLKIQATSAWAEAKQTNNWEAFKPYLQQLIDTMREMAHYQDPNKDAYEVWLDSFEEGSSVEFYNHFFDEVRKTVVPLLAECMNSKHQPSTDAVQGSFDEHRQWALADDLLDIEGLDRDALWLGKTEHPYTGGPGIGFVAIASHVYENNILSNVFSMLHEGGHALYEQNVNWDFRFTSLKGGTSMGMHESISRFFENYIGRSEAFTPVLLETLRRHFPGQFNRVTPYQLYQAENAAQPGFIRTEADELTYPLHIMIRFEIEQRLFNGSLAVDDVPEAWADLYEQYLGIRPSTYTQGCLQDVHWSQGYFGYFPTYALGSALGAQYLHAMEQDGLDVVALTQAGELAPIKEWLRKNIWQWGRAYTCPELVKEATGEAFNPRYYTDYLTQKFSAIYQLNR